MSQESNAGTPPPFQEGPGSQPMEATIIPDPQIAWETHTVISTPNSEAVWHRVKHMGLVGDPADGGENGVGWGLPGRFTRLLLEISPSTDIPAGASPMQADAAVRDVPRASYVVTREVDDERMTILWESDWPEPGQQRMRYTYRVALEPGVGGTTVIRTGLRAVNVGNPQPGDSELDGEALAKHGDSDRAEVTRSGRARRRAGWLALKNRLTRAANAAETS